MPGTFKQHALPGEDINNPADNVRVGQRILAGYLQKYNGDAARAAVAYFSGPGNVSPPGSPTPWIRNKGDGNNTVAQYVAAAADLQWNCSGRRRGPSDTTGRCARQRRRGAGRAQRSDRWDRD